MLMHYSLVLQHNSLDIFQFARQLAFWGEPTVVVTITDHLSFLPCFNMVSLELHKQKINKIHVHRLPKNTDVVIQNPGGVLFIIK